MGIDHETFLAWAKTAFGDDLRVAKNEVKINSPFVPSDTGYHLWCNPSGGKRGIAHGCYRCFKSDTSGTLVNLVMRIDKCSYDVALQKLNGEHVDINKELEFFDEDEEIQPLEIKDTVIKFPEFCTKIIFSNYYWKQHASKYLLARKIPPDDFYICTDGRYKNRILIPYFNKNNELVYWNTRAIGNSRLRYMGPEKSIGVGKEDVIYFPRIPQDDDFVYVTEGEFDAYSLYLCGLDAAAAGGKSISDKQAIKLNKYRIVLALDTDEAGKEALPKMLNKLKIYNGNEVLFIRPAEGYKDWNKMLEVLGPKIVRGYIEAQQKIINPEDLII